MNLWMDSVRMENATFLTPHTPWSTATYVGSPFVELIHIIFGQQWAADGEREWDSEGCVIIIVVVVVFVYPLNGRTHIMVNLNVYFAICLFWLGHIAFDYIIWLKNMEHTHFLSGIDL